MPKISLDPHGEPAPDSKFAAMQKADAAGSEDLRALLQDPSEFLMEQDAASGDTSTYHPDESETSDISSMLMDTADFHVQDTDVEEPKGESLADKIGFKDNTYKAPEQKVNGKDHTDMPALKPLGGPISKQGKKLGEGLPDRMPDETSQMADLIPEASGPGDAPLEVGIRGVKSAEGRDEDEGPISKAMMREYVYAYRHHRGRRRIFTHIIPGTVLLAVIGIGGWYWLLPYLLVQGQWEGKIVDLDNHAVPISFNLDRHGRQVNGTVHFTWPRLENNEIDMAEVPAVLSSVIDMKQTYAEVHGEFDVNTVHLKITSGSPDQYAYLHGDLSRDEDRQMNVLGDAETSDGKNTGNFVLFRTSLE
ncbi:MAG: hypothetical protein H6683_00265 [Deltaproteobacteria bacterium]|nr:hypothetical protein [Deltaproteobacteria bacterium]